MVKISLLIEGEPAELQDALVRLAANADGIRPEGSPQPGDWKPEEFAQFWRTLQDGARMIMAEIAKRPESYPFSDLRRAVRLEGLQIAGRLSSIGHVLRQFPGKKLPLTRDYNARVYRMPGEVAQMILQIVNGEKP